MAQHLLSVFARPSAPVGIAADAVDTWVRRIGRRLAVTPGGLVEIQGDPFEAVIELDEAPRDEELVTAVGEAFEACDVVAGLVGVSVSEHEADDPDFEAPPWLELELDLGDLHTRRSAVTVSVEVEAASDLDQSAISALDRALRAVFPHEVFFCGQVRGMSQRLRFLLVPLPPALAPDEASARARALEAVAAAAVAVSWVEVGAYVGDWGNTLYQAQIRPA
jgi:hypothetical protein